MNSPMAILALIAVVSSSLPAYAEKEGQEVFKPVSSTRLSPELIGLSQESEIEVLRDAPVSVSYRGYALKASGEGMNRRAPGIPPRELRTSPRERISPGSIGGESSPAKNTKRSGFTPAFWIIGFVLALSTVPILAGGSKPVIEAVYSLFTFRR